MPASSDGAARIRDDQEIGIELVFLVIQQRDALFGRCRPHRDAFAELGQIVGMHRLPQFHHHIVGDIDDG